MNMPSVLLPVTDKLLLDHEISASSAESELVIELLAGDTKALERLYLCYSAALLGIISKIIKQE